MVNSRRPRWMIGLLLVWAALFLTGCVAMEDVESSQEQRQDAVAHLEDGETFRQGFSVRRRGLIRVDVWLRPVEQEGGEGASALVELRRVEPSGGLSAVISHAELSPEQLRSSPQVGLAMPAQVDSEGSRYVISILSKGGQVEVLGRLADVYGGGEASVDGNFLLADAAFLLSYEYGPPHLLADLESMLARIWLALPLAVVLLLPGWLLLVWLGLDRCFDWGERMALSLGLSLAVIPVLMAWTSLAGMHWSRSAVLAAAGVMTALATYRVWKALPLVRGRLAAFRSTRRMLRRIVLRRSVLRRGPSISLGLVVVFLMALFVRMAMARDLSAPPWVDAVHHALVTRLILERGAYPESYAPFIEIDPASYHPGFHSVLASFLWLSHLDLLEGMLLFGQVLNALIVFPVYLFTTTLSRNRLAGLAAALFAGLFTSMPAYYTSWGRYTQLAGLVILPVVLALLLLPNKVRQGEEKRDEAILRTCGPFQMRGEPLPSKKSLPSLIFLTALASAGLILTHYRVAGFLGALLACWLLVAGLKLPFAGAEQRHREFQTMRNLWLPYLATALLSLVLAAPLLLPSITSLLAPKLSAWRPSGRDPFEGVGWAYLHAAWGKPVTVLAELGLVWSAARRRSIGILLAAWAAALFAIANLGALGLPGSGFVNSTSVTISLFLPLSALAGYSVSQGISLARHLVARISRRKAFLRPAQGDVAPEPEAPLRWRGTARWMLAAMGTAAAILAARPMLTLLNPVTFLYRPADRPALEWAAANIPEGATVLVNPFAWGYGQYAGNDGGYWLSAMAGLPTLPPPVLYGLSNDPDTIQRINRVSQKVIDDGANPEALHALLTGEGISFVFIGNRGGAISVHALSASPYFALRYARDGAFVFEVLE